MYGKIKRGIDVTVSFALLLMLLPLLLVMAWLVRWDSPGRSIFTQQRVGRFGRPFLIYKFRTMRVGAPANTTAAEKKTTEPYITPLGRFLRRSSLDELPQLFNVLKGDMSLIGPRPVVPVERELVRLRHQNGAERVRPGITGLAQVHGRGKLSPEQKAWYDAQYAREMSLWVDIRIVFLTLRCLLHGG